MKRANKDAIDQLVLADLSSEGQSITDLCRMGMRIGTVRAALKRLVATGEVKRRWNGNQRFGRYLYFAQEEKP